MKISPQKQDGHEGRPKPASIDLTERPTQYTIDQAIEECGHGKFQRRVYLAAFLIWWADTAEIMVLSFLTTVLQPLWGLTNAQSATIFSSVFIGEVVGSLLLGPVADRLGRRPVFLATVGICGVFGFLTAAANTYSALIGIRFMVGFAIGGLTVPFDTLAEFLPEIKRGKILATLNYSWQFGQLLIILFAYLTLGTSGNESGGNNAANNRPWKIFVTLSACPTVIAMVVSVLYVPESPRWLLAKGKGDTALKNLRDVARTNGKQPTDVFPEGTALIEGKENEEGNIRELVKPAWRKATLMVCTVWAINGFFYFAAIQIATNLSSKNSSSSSSSTATDNTTTSFATAAYTLDYLPIVIGALFEAFGQIFPTLWIDTIGRNPFQTICYFVAAVSMVLYGFLPSHLGQESVIIVARMCGTVAYVCMSVQISELLPTSLRGKGHSLASLCQRMGGLASPYVVESALSRESMGGLLAACCVVALVATCTLPETKRQIFGGVVEHILVEEEEEEDRRSTPIVDEAVAESSQWK